MTIPFTDLRPLLRDTESEWRGSLERLMDRGHFILGDELASFEREFAAGMGAHHAIGVSTGTSAIELCLRAAGLYGTGREVLTSPLTAPFTGLAILAAGCRPRFADIDENLLLSVNDARGRTSRRTAAVMPVHLYGQTCELEGFAALSRDTGAALIQDACQAHGALHNGKPLAAFSPFVAYSFYPTKNLGCLGDGGAVVTNSAAVARRIRLLRDGARGPGHVSREAALNARLDEVQACFLRAFLSRLCARNEARRQLAAVYDKGLRGCPGVQVVQHSPGSVYHLYVIRARRREGLRRHLAEHGIATAIHYPVPLHLQPAFRECGLGRGDLPTAERAAREIVSLPLWPDMPAGAALEVIDRIRGFYRV